MRFDPMGQMVGPTGVAKNLSDAESVEQIPGFTGHETTASAGMIHMNARLFDQRIGVFLGPDIYVDPKKIASLNRFSYVQNDPLSYSDPSGNVGERILRQGTEIYHASRVNQFPNNRKIKAKYVGGRFDQRAGVEFPAGPGWFGEMAHTGEANKISLEYFLYASSRRIYFEKVRGDNIEHIYIHKYKATRDINLASYESDVAMAEEITRARSLWKKIFSDQIMSFRYNTQAKSLEKGFFSYALRRRWQNPVEGFHMVRQGRRFDEYVLSERGMRMLSPEGYQAFGIFRDTDDSVYFVEQLERGAHRDPMVFHRDGRSDFRQIADFYNSNRIANRFRDVRLRIRR